MAELGQMERPTVESFARKRKLYCVANIYPIEKAPDDYKELFNKYWNEVEQHLERLEIAGKIKHMIFDKTGTITKGVPEVTDVIGIKKTMREVIEIAASLEKVSEHSLADAILRHAAKYGVTIKKARSFKAIPGIGIEANIGSKKYYFGNSKLMNRNRINISKYKQKLYPVNTSPRQDTSGGYPKMYLVAFIFYIKHWNFSNSNALN